MSTWLEEIDDGYDSESDEYEGESDSEDARSDAARRARARARRIAAARARRQAIARSGARAGTVARAPTPQQAVAAIRNVDLESKVSNDALRQDLERANRRAERATYVTVASLAVDQTLDTFRNSVGRNAFVRTGLRFAPLLLLSPARNRRGVAGVALHPAVMGGVALAGILATGELVNRRLQLATDQVSFSGAPKGKLVVTDRNGLSVTPQPIWGTSSDTKVLTIKADGSYTAKKVGGPLVVTATPVGGQLLSFAVTVVP